MADQSSETDENSKEEGARERDFTVRPFSAVLLWGAPMMAIGAVNFFDTSRALSNSILAISFLWMGYACLWNARRCGRVHCMFTGPLFLMAAIMPIGELFGLFQLEPSQWNLYAITVLLLLFLMMFVPERIWGKYRGNNG